MKLAFHLSSKHTLPLQTDEGEEAAEEELGFARRRRNCWFDQECEEAARERKKTRKEWLDDRADLEKKERFRNARNVATLINRRKKREQVKEDLRKIEEDRQQGNTRSMFQGIGKQRKGYQARNEIIKDKDGRIVVDQDQIERRWVEYFTELLNRPPPVFPVDEEEACSMDMVMPPSEAEVLAAINRLKNHKAAGIDSVHAEQIKYGGENLKRKICSQIQNIWHGEYLPQDWEEGVMVPLHKKGDRTSCDNYRGICVLPIGYKILVRLIYQRLQLYTEDILGEYQAGFRPERGTSDQIFTLRQILEKYREFGKESYHLFVDFKQAYDSVHRQSLWNILLLSGIPNKLIRLIHVLQ